MPNETEKVGPETRRVWGLLRWVLGFAQAQVTQWKAGDWINALEEAYLLLAWGETAPEVQARLPGLRGYQNTSVEEAKSLLGPLQSELATLIKRVMPLQSPSPGSKPLKLAVQGEVYLVLDRYHRLRSFYAPNESDAKRAFAMTVVWRVADLLTRVYLPRLKRCPECGRVFLAEHRKQRFDTPQCSLRDRVRRFRDKKAPARGRRKRLTRKKRQRIARQE